MKGKHGAALVVKRLGPRSRLLDPSVHAHHNLN